MKVARWGNSLAVRLPSTLVEELGLKEGDDIDLARGRNPDQLEVTRAADLEAVMTALRKLNSSLPADFKFNRDEANER